jgi:hypothetical protein
MQVSLFVVCLKKRGLEVASSFNRIDLKKTRAARLDGFKPNRIFNLT